MEISGAAIVSSTLRPPPREHLCAALRPEKIDEGRRHAEARPRQDSGSVEGGRSAFEGIASMVEIETCGANVYTNLGRTDADEMLVKAQLASKIGDIIKRRKLPQAQAAEILGIPQAKLSGLLRGQFRGVSEAKLMDCRA